MALPAALKLFFLFPTPNSALSGPSGDGHIPPSSSLPWSLEETKAPTWGWRVFPPEHARKLPHLAT